MFVTIPHLASIQINVKWGPNPAITLQLTYENFKANQQYYKFDEGKLPLIF